MSATDDLERTWKSRIIRTGEIDPKELTANPANWRRHPKHQRAALRDLLDRVGWVQGVVINDQSGHLVDGHLRAELAVEDEADAVPAIWVDLSEDEERLVLAALDPIGDLAAADADAFRALLASVEVDSEALEGMFGDLTEKLKAAVAEPDSAVPADETDFWPYIRVQVSRDTLKAWEQWFPSQTGENDDERIQTVMKQLEPPKRGRAKKPGV
jgi:hypothetical protein